LAIAAVMQHVGDCRTCWSMPSVQLLVHARIFSLFNRSSVAARRACMRHCML
jgi:hypothetical protein